jgi:alanine racemase
VNEAIQLRQGGIECPILLLGHCDYREISQLVELSLTPVVGSIAYLKLLEEETIKQHTKLDVHIIIDTGMGRLGCSPEETEELAIFIDKSPYLKLAGCCTHFPVSDSSKKEHKDFTERQIESFKKSIDQIKKLNIDPGLLHGKTGYYALWILS